MTVCEVAESSSPFTTLRERVKWSARRQKPAASLVFFPRPPWVPWDGVGWRQVRGAAGRLGRPLLLLLTSTPPELHLKCTLPAVARTVRFYAEKGRPETRVAVAGSVCVGLGGPLCRPVRDEKTPEEKNWSLGPVPVSTYVFRERREEER